jgi:hypothetical protein
MGWSVYCTICGGPDTLCGMGGFADYKDTKKYKELQWLKNIMGITSDNKIIKKIYNYNYGGGYNYNKGDFWVSPDHWFEFITGGEYGIMCHKDCYKLLQKELKYNLKFGDICRILNDYSPHLKSESKYGKMRKYSFGQDFEVIKAYTKDKYLLLNPLKNTENNQRIIKMWTPLVKRFIKNKIRPSPCASATNFNEGTILKGSDSKLWIVSLSGKTNKWIRYNGDIKKVQYIERKRKRK